MSKHTILGVIVLMSISLLGVVGLQLYWINDAIKVKQEQFDRSVNAALTKVVEKLETHEAVSVVAGQMASLNKPSQATPLDTTATPAPATEQTRVQPLPEPAKQTAKPPAQAPKPQPEVFKVPVPAPHGKAKATGGGVTYSDAGPIYGTAPADYILVSPTGSIKIQRRPEDPVTREKHLKEQARVMTTTRVAASVPASGSYLNIARSKPDTVHLRKMVQGKKPLTDTVFQWEKVKEYTRRADSAALIFRTQHKQAIHISVDTLRFLAAELYRMKQPGRLPIEIKPAGVSSINVRNDSIFVFLSDTAKQIYLRRLTTARPENEVSAATWRETTPTRVTAPLRGAAVLQESKVAKPIKIITEGNASSNANPLKVPNAKTNVSDIEKIEIKKDMLNDVVQKMVVEYAVKDEPLQQRLNLHVLQHLLKAELQQQGISLGFGYWVVAGQADTVAAQNINAIKNQNLPSYKATLFPNDIFDKPDYLGLYFPDSKAYAMKSLWGMLALSALFTLVIIATFGTTIHIIYKQKKLSEMKNDFINNMTHEFKTPIATISLATDSIVNPKVYENPDKIKYYTRIIREENKRMNSQVENVLQIALLEKNEFKMNLQPIDVHTLIMKAIEGIRLQVEQRLGQVNVQLDALQHELQSDEVHLYNVICNLLDNANKYSPASPDIQLRTKNLNGGILIAVEDKGIGMSKDTQQRVFEKFYRVPTGNLHNVKGFGLGLSYVKAIVQAHHGDIKLKSELGKGSRFEIFLPLR
ncbi:hypothetical protein GCM10027443_15520 [Pontibacter brevis]